MRTVFLLLAVMAEEHSDLHKLLAQKGKTKREHDGTINLTSNNFSRVNAKTFYSYEQS